MENKSPFILLFVSAVFGGIFVDIQVGNIFAEENEFTSLGFISRNSIPLYTILFLIGVFIMYKTVFSDENKDENE